MLYISLTKKNCISELITLAKDKICSGLVNSCIDMTEWITAMSHESSVGSRAILLNIIYDLEVPQTLQNEHLCKFFQSLGISWQHSSGQSATSIFCEVSKSNDNYLCQGSEVVTAGIQCSRVMDVKTLFENNINKKVLGWWISEEPLEEWQIEILEEPGISTTIGKGEVKGRSRPIAWVTKTGSLDEIFDEHESTSERASIIRNCLGLNHFREGVQLIEVQYHQEIIERTHLKSPMFLDGCYSSSYITQPIYRSLLSDDGWGTTVNLETYEEGLPEAVHTPISFGEGFTLRYIGQAAVLELPYDSQKFINSFPISWSGDSSTHLVDLVIKLVARCNGSSI
jgi:hypothetical protein